MIILRQKEFGFGGFDWAFDNDGKLRTDMSEEDQRKFEAMKKKHPDEWKEFQRRQKNKSSGSSGSSSYTSDGGHKYYRNGDKVYTEEEANRLLKKSKRRRNAAWGISMGTWAADIANSQIRNEIKQKRIDEVDDIVGHSRNMKRSDRAEINTYKSKSKKSRENLHKSIDPNLSREKQEDAAKKYVRREAWNEASNKAIHGASIGSGLGHIAGWGKELGENVNGVTGLGKNELYGTLIGAGLGAGLGALGGGLRSRSKNKKLIKKLQNSKDKEKELDKIKVSKGEMTESEFVEKHGGKEK
jgi:hypothetical protein